MTDMTPERLKELREMAHEDTGDACSGLHGSPLEELFDYIDEQARELERLRAQIQKWLELANQAANENRKIIAERDSLRRRVAELEGPSSPGVTPLDMELVQTQLELREARAELERIQDERDDLRRRLDGCLKALEDEKERCDKLDRHFWGAEALRAARAPNGGGGDNG